MHHLKTISRPQLPARGVVSPLESVIMLVMGVFFGDWDNYGSVANNMRKFYEKTD